MSNEENSTSEFSREEIMDMHPKGKPLTPDGREVLDPVPMDPPIGYFRQPSLADQIREMVRSEKLRAEAHAAGYESFEEADDFEVGDDYDPTSPYELDDEMVPVAELKRRSSRSKKNDKSPDQGDPVTEAAQPPQSELDIPSGDRS